MNKTETDRTMVLKQIIFLLIVVLALLLVLGLLLSRAAIAGESAQPGAPVSLSTMQDRSDRDRALREAAERRYLKRRGENHIHRENGDVRVLADETIDGHLVVTRGTVTIAGRVTGSVLAIRGDVLVESTGEVLGDVVSIGGQVERRSNSRVFGDIVETSARYLNVRDDEYRHERYYDERRDRRRRQDRRQWHDNWEDDFNEKIHYNRVDGLFLGGAMPRRYDRRYLANIDVFGFGGYAIKSKRWQYEAGAEFYFGRAFRLALGGEVYDFTDTQDEWIIPELENSLAAALINEDFRDYYRRDGFSFYLSQNLGWPLKLTAAYRNDHHFDLEKKTDWSLFVNKKEFRPNPPITPGKMISYLGRIDLDTRDHKDHPRRGWLISLEGETSRPEFESEFDFDRILADIRRYQPIGYGKNLDLRLRAGSAQGILPAQYLFDLGGISTLRGFRFKEFTGDRMVLANVEYRLNAGASRLHGIPVIEDLDLILFFDAGYTWFAEDNSAVDKSFDFLTADKLKTNVGISVTDSDGQVRLNFAKRTDVSGKDVAVTFRLNRDF
jgi:hypothetical protein